MTMGVPALRTIADYQFGAGSGDVLFPDGSVELAITRTNSGRPRQIKLRHQRLATYGTDGRFRLGLAGARRLQDGFDEGYRVTVGSESEPYIREGRNAFAKFVLATDGTIRPRDEVIVEHSDGSLLGVGRAVLSGTGMETFDTGMAVKVRHGAPE